MVKMRFDALLWLFSKSFGELTDFQKKATAV